MHGVDLGQVSPERLPGLQLDAVDHNSPRDGVLECGVGHCFPGCL